ncbi:MAG: NAD(P)-dependent oxidoreductase [Hyphomicrobiales bacterium]
MSLIRPGATLGILGGGQLGRMLAHAAQRLGYDVAIYDPDPEAPAARVAARMHYSQVP